MHLYIFTSTGDYSMQLIEQELAQRKIPFDTYFFKNMVITDNVICIGDTKLAIQPTDRILIRNSWNSPYFTRDYSMLARQIIEAYPSQIVFDAGIFEKHIPYFLDKLYQAFFYRRLGIRTPAVWYFPRSGSVQWDTLPFPCVLKKRISSRSRANFLINTKQELEDRLPTIPLHTYLIQEYINAKRDIRLNILKGKVLYAFERTMQMHTEDNRLYVKGGKPLKTIPPELEEAVQTVSREVGADFAGIDFLEGMDGTYYLIETNLSPQFYRAQDIMPLKTARLVVDEIINS